MKNHWLIRHDEKSFNLIAAIQDEIDKEVIAELRAYVALKDKIVSDTIKTGDALDIQAINNCLR